MNKDLESNNVILKRWSPKRLTAEDISNLVEDFGLNHDSLTEIRDEHNIVEWEIEINIKKTGGDQIWP